MASLRQTGLAGISPIVRAHSTLHGICEGAAVSLFAISRCYAGMAAFSGRVSTPPLSWLGGTGPEDLTVLLRLSTDMQLQLGPGPGPVHVVPMRRRGTARTRQGRQRGAVVVNPDQFDDKLFEGYVRTLRARRMVPACCHMVPEHPAKAIVRQRRAERRRTGADAFAAIGREAVHARRQALIAEMRVAAAANCPVRLSGSTGINRLNERCARSLVPMGMFHFMFPRCKQAKKKHLPTQQIRTLGELLRVLQCTVLDICSREGSNFNLLCPSSGTGVWVIREEACGSFVVFSPEAGFRTVRLAPVNKKGPIVIKRCGQREMVKVEVKAHGVLVLSAEQLASVLAYT
jgi:hypothetical protein